MDRCGSFSLLSVPHSLSLSLASEQTLKDLKWSREVRRWIWLAGLSGLHRNSPLGFNISYIKTFPSSCLSQVVNSFSTSFRNNWLARMCKKKYFNILSLLHHHHHNNNQKVLPKGGLSSLTQEPRLQFCWGWIDAVASHCFPNPTHPLASELTLKDPSSTTDEVRRVDSVN